MKIFFALALTLTSLPAFAALNIDCSGVAIRNTAAGTVTVVDHGNGAVSGQFQFDVSRQGHDDEVTTVTGAFDGTLTVVGNENTGTIDHPTNRNIKALPAGLKGVNGGEGDVALLQVNLDWPAAPGNSFIRLKNGGGQYFMNCSEVK